jgi:YesN/AraC family two-component response regulator
MNELLSKPRILFVDDEESIISRLKRILHPYKNEWEVHFAQSGIEALEIMEKTPVNVIISDMRMPVMNGAELLLQVQQKYPETIRIILSGQSDEELIMKSIKVAPRFFFETMQSRIISRSY